MGRYGNTTLCIHDWRVNTVWIRACGRRYRCASGDPNVRICLISVEIENFLKVCFGHKAAILILELRISVGSLTAARRNYLGVRCVPITASGANTVSVGYGLISAADLEDLRVCIWTVKQYLSAEALK